MKYEYQVGQVVELIRSVPACTSYARILQSHFYPIGTKFIIAKKYSSPYAGSPYGLKLFIDGIALDQTGRSDLCTASISESAYVLSVESTKSKLHKLIKDFR